METPPCSILTKDRTTDMEDPEVRSRGQHFARRNEPSRNEEDIKVGNMKIKTTTVGGILLVEYMKKKKTSYDMKTTPTKRKRKKSPRRALKTTPYVENNRKIWEYLEKKKPRITSETMTNSIGDEEDIIIEDYKTSEENLQSVKVQEHVSSIKQIPELEKGDGCVIGSGRCATHNMKTVRVVNNVKQSVRMGHSSGGCVRQQF